MFGIPVLQVQDILGKQPVTPIPLAPNEVAGALNLRGRIVTAIDVRNKLDLAPHESDKSMSIVVEHKGGLFSLIIDEVGDVLNLDNTDYEQTPVSLDPLWRAVSLGIYRLDSELLVVLDVPKLLDAGRS